MKLLTEMLASAESVKRLHGRSPRKLSKVGFLACFVPGPFLQQCFADGRLAFEHAARLRIYSGVTG